MSESELETTDEGSEETGDATQKPATVSIKSYQTLQRELQKTKDENKTLKEQYEGAPPLEEQIAARDQELKDLKNKLQVSEIKADAPEIADVIDMFVEKHGVVPDADVIESLKKVAKPSDAGSNTSGRRSSNARVVKTEDDRMDEILKNGKVFDF